ncbi:hypothetical protein C8A00DRAFT_11324 [Chaetomidium leptoderma]|uniref:Uncharacterized protein n=1 Tax=Chaetomidium leptoderma TaxID=669021 RepID=A0AAN6VXC2_9PEZI|nr:hypothetical protein C8A00DRAFT_11324 [Chaetomidium leptoderma]
MCYTEFIAYQCGHRSVGVVRPCPLTTAGHNFPVCGIPPDKPHYAETMCTACERQLHSRWVLIREWEHRWLHERGVCGCEVTFPGLLTTPRVIGEPSAAGTAASTAGTAALAAAKDDKHSAAPKAITAAAESSNTVQPKTGHGDAGDVGDDRIPALFAEAVTSTGEHRVAVRLSSLYAAEWPADHRALHDAGKCSCLTSFAPYQPQVPDDELTPHDQNNLCRWRDMEAGQRKNKHDTRNMDGQAGETMRRLADIERAFGKFELEDEQPPTAPRVRLPRLTGTAAAENQVVEARGHSQGNNGRHHNSRRFENRRERAAPSHRQPLPSTQPHNPPLQNQGGHSQLMLASSQSPILPYHPHPSQTFHHLHHPYPPPPFTVHPPATGYVYPEYPPHQQPHYFTPAYPVYATPATYTDTIPVGAYPWTAEPKKTPGMPWLTQGPGPYRTPGLSYAAHHQQEQQHHDQGQGQGQSRQLGPATPSSSEGDDDSSSSENGSGSGDGNGNGEQPQPLCGLPIGAGPEGTSHMPSWEGCMLRRNGRSVDALVVAGAGAGGEEGENEEDQIDMEDEDEDEEEGEREGQDNDDNGDDKTLPPPSPPPRRHSASA